MRERYAIRGHVVKDYLASYFCTPCALTQERREVELEEASFQAVQQVVEVEK
jgi:PLAC8 family